jgi:hypothetical protein
MIPHMVGQAASPGNAGLTLDQWRAWQWLRVHLREDRDRWTDRALVHLRFLRWLTQSGRRLPAEGRPRLRAVMRGGLRKVSGQMDGRITPLVPLPVGTLAPDFTLAQTPLTGVALRSLRGRPVVLVIYPMDWEPVSREQLSLYQAFAGEFFIQASLLYRNVMTPIDRDHLVSNIVGQLGNGVQRVIQERAVRAYWAKVDPELGARVARGLDLDPATDARTPAAR